MMKISIVILFLIVLSGSVQPQTPPSQNSQSSLQIIRFGWSKYQQGGLETGVSAAGDKKPQGNSQTDRQIEILRQQAPENKQTIEDLEEIKRQRQRAPVGNSKRPAEKISYKYTLEVQNTSAKQIVEVAWDYVFTDPKTNQEALRHHFVTKVKIRPDKNAKLAVYNGGAPYQVVSVTGASNNKNEQVVIKRIVYSDGSVWQG